MRSIYNQPKRHRGTNPTAVYSVDTLAENDDAIRCATILILSRTVCVAKTR